jgi:DNA-binding CsgD family transcriptional regulator
VADKGLRITHLGDGLILLSLPAVRAASATSGRARLTGAEAEVAALAVRGLANRAIADARGSSQRTVANQLASIYAKLGISGRRELRALSR